MMFCPNCSSELGENTLCPNCGFSVDSKIDPVEGTTVNPVPTTDKILLHTDSVKQSKGILQARGILTVKTVIFSVLGLVVLVLFFSAASKIAESGLNIMDIQSVGGKTLEEAYYLELGGLYAGYATISRGLGLFFASTLVWLGFRK